MSDLRPRGVKIVLDGVERRFLFTLNAIDEVQSHYEMTAMEALGKLFEPAEQGEALRFFVMTLINDEVEREKHKNSDNQLALVTEKEVGWMIGMDNIDEVTKAILEAYHISVPEPEEEEDPNQKSGQQSN